MVTNIEKIEFDKYLNINSIIYNGNNKKFFNTYDELLASNRFMISKRLSIEEEIITISSINLTIKELKRVVLNFILKDPIDLVNRADLYGILKISNLPSTRLSKVFKDDVYYSLLEKIKNIIPLTTTIGHDFVISKTLRNLAAKIANTSIKKDYIQVKRSLLKDIVTKEYLPEEVSKIPFYLNWVDYILYETINNDILIGDFINLNEKILNQFTDKLDLYWKVLSSINYLSSQYNSDDLFNLRRFKSRILRNIISKYAINDFSKDTVLNTAISILSKESPNKEDFYYLFNMLKKSANNTENDKFFALRLCEYIVYLNGKQNIFCFRFIRESFLTMLASIISKKDSLRLKEKEIKLLIVLFNNDSFFYVHKDDIFQKIIYLLFDFKNSDNTLSHRKFSKYYNVIDYILSKNKDLKYLKVIECLDKKNEISLPENKHRNFISAKD